MEFADDEICGYIWVGTQDGMIGDHSCHYEVIFHGEGDGNPDVASVEVHFEEPDTRKSFQGIPLPEKLGYAEWWTDEEGETTDGRIVYADKDVAIKSKNAPKEIIKRLRELEKLIGQSLRAAVRKQIPEREQIVISETMEFRRKPALAKEAVENADYKCELNARHKSFTTSNGNTYMEAHHLIPLSKQKEFDRSLNQAANIVCLCPNCHREIHYGENRNEMIETLLKQRATKLRGKRIGITLKKLQGYYA